jgi:hypothetical protein
MLSQLSKSQISVLNKIIEDKIPRQIEVDGKLMIFSIFDPKIDQITHNYDVLKVDKDTSHAERTCLQITPTLIGKYVNEIDIIRKSSTSKTTFRGNRMEQYVGILYFIKKYPYDCVPIDIKEYMNINKIFITWDLDEEKLIVPENYEKMFEMCQSSKKVRFVCSMVNLLSKQEGHTNGILYDKNDNTIEIYEPYGNTEIVKNKYQRFYLEITKYFKEKLKVSNIYLPSDFCPIQGHQELQTNEKQTHTLDPKGFCAAWSLWWIDYRLKNADIKSSRKQLYDESMKILEKSEESLTKFIRNYADFICKEVQTIKDKVIKKHCKNHNNYQWYEITLFQSENRFNEISKQQIKLINIQKDFDNILIKENSNIINELTNLIETIISAYEQLVNQRDKVKKYLIIDPNRFNQPNSINHDYNLTIIRLKELRNDLRNNIFQKPHEFKSIIDETIEQNTTISDLYSSEICKLIEMDLYLKINEDHTLYSLIMIEILTEMKKYTN